MMKRALICLLVFMGLFAYSIAGAEIKIFEQEVEEAVSRGQSQEQVEAFALQKAKRLAVEEAGTYISSLTTVKNYQLQSDEVTALASGVVHAKIIGVPSVRLKNGIVHVKVKARIDVDTAVLDRQIAEIMKEKGTLKKLEEERKKNKELEEKLANLKSTEVKRLEELNAQAIAWERERDRQRLIREEQALKARGELSKAEAERIAKEREMRERINRTLAEQEKAKREEAAALAAEQDKIKRAQLENEQRWNDLTRKAKLVQDSWAAIDDSLSFKQAMSEVTDLKKEIANLKNRLDFQYGENIKNLQAAYVQQRALSGAKLPPAPTPKDAFETRAEYNDRLAAYKHQVKAAKAAGGEAVVKLEKEEILKLAEAKVDYLGQQIRVLAPFVDRLEALQARKFTLPEGGAMTVELGAPDADNSRFPLALKNKGKSWSFWWNYDDRDQARDFYKTRTHLKAKGLFQIEEGAVPRPRLTAARVSHLATEESRDFALGTPVQFVEIRQFAKFRQDEETARERQKRALYELTRKVIARDGRFIAYDDGTFLDIRTNLTGASKQELLELTSKVIATDGRFIAYNDGTVLDTRTNLTGASKQELFKLTSKVIARDGRFIAYDDGTVLDTRTSLMWAANDNGRNINWPDAKSYCENYRGGGYSDWRMPTYEELAGLYDGSKSYQVMARQRDYEVHLTKLITLSSWHTWSSDADGSGAAFFIFTNGTRYWTYHSQDSRALPVRSFK